MKLNFNNVGRGLESVANAYTTRKFKDAFDKARSDATAEAEASGGLRNTVSPESFTGMRVDSADGKQYTQDLEIAKTLAAQEADIAQLRDQPDARAATAGSLGLGTFASIPLDRELTKDEIARHSDQRPPAGASFATPATTTPLPPRDGDTTPLPPRDGDTAAPGLAPQKDQWTNVTDEKVGVSSQVEVPKKDAAKIFESRHLPTLTGMLVSHGKLTEAQALKGWAQDETRAKALDSLGAAWERVSAGDAQSALAPLTKFYNSNVMPDGMFAVVKPGKNGEYTLQQFDDKTGKLVSEATGSADVLARQGIAHIAGPEGLMKFALTEHQARTAAAVENAKDLRNHSQAMELEQLKAQHTGLPDIAKLHTYVAGLREKRAAATDPLVRKQLDGEIASADAVIKVKAENPMSQLALAVATGQRADAGLGLQQVKENRAAATNAKKTAKEEAADAADAKTVREFETRARKDGGSATGYTNIKTGRPAVPSADIERISKHKAYLFNQGGK